MKIENETTNIHDMLELCETRGILIGLELALSIFYNAEKDLYSATPVGIMKLMEAKSEIRDILHKKETKLKEYSNESP